jgi:hypothetical protein
MFGDWASIREKVFVGVITAVVLGALTLLWNWSSSGGIVRALGGITQADAEAIVKRLALAGPPGPAGQAGPPGATGPSGIAPPGAVVAFATECPTGWTPFVEGTGRFIVGAGDQFHRVYRTWKRNRPTGGFDEVQLSAYTPLSAGGEEQHVLSVDEMPAHDHGIQIIQHSEYLRENKGYVGTETVGRDDSIVPNRTAPRTDPKGPVRYTEAVGSGRAYNLMPPFIALVYCRKN